jgi:hypothetical protein
MMKVSLGEAASRDLEAIYNTAHTWLLRNGWMLDERDVKIYERGMFNDWDSRLVLVRGVGFVL